MHEGDEEINGGGGEGRGIRSSVARGAVARALPPAPWRWWRCTRRWWWRCTRNCRTRNCRTRTAPIPLHEALLPQQLRHEEFHPVLPCDELPHDASPLPLHEELMHEELMHEASRSRCTRGRCTRGRCTRVSRSWCTRIHCVRSVESCRPGARGAVARGEPPVLVHGEVMREAPPPQILVHEELLHQGALVGEVPRPGARGVARGNVARGGVARVPPQSCCTRIHRTRSCCTKPPSPSPGARGAAARGPPPNPAVLGPHCTTPPPPLHDWDTRMVAS